jgi:hypothetical protein
LKPKSIQAIIVLSSPRVIFHTNYERAVDGNYVRGMILNGKVIQTSQTQLDFEWQSEIDPDRDKQCRMLYREMTSLAGDFSGVENDDVHHRGIRSFGGSW